MKLFRRNLLAIACLSYHFIACNDHAGNAPDEHAAFTHPAWIAQSNIYEVNVRQYTPEGTFKAFAAQLPRLKQMGVDILWFMPVTPISKVDRKGSLGSYYAVADYKAINPEFGTMEDFKEMVQTAHDGGFKVIIDWVANHTGADHSWLKDHPDFYNRDSTGKAMYAFDWSDTRDLNYDNRELRDSMIQSMKYWITETDIDGFRCDVAGEVPDDFWKACIDTLRHTKEIFMLAEGEKPSLQLAGFDATYNWEMFHAMVDIAAGNQPAAKLDSVLLHMDTTFPAGAVYLYFTSNHDENSWNGSDFKTFPGPVHAPFAVLTQTMKASLPLVYSGQEEPVLRAIPFFEKDSMEFKNFARERLYSTLLNLRESTPALAVDASFKKISVGNDKALYAFIRQKGVSKVLVIANLSASEQTIQFNDAAVVGEPLNVFMGLKEKIGKGHRFNIEPWGYVVYEY